MLFPELILASFFLYVLIRGFNELSEKISGNSFRRLVMLTLCGYFLVYVFLTMFSRIPGERVLNLIPFRAIFKLFGINPDLKIVIGGKAIELAYGTSTVLYGILSFLLNILLYVPLGYLLPVLLKNRPRTNMLKIACGLSLLTEIIQIITALGFFDVDDLIANLIGAMIGYSFFLKGMHERVDYKAPLT